MCLLPHKRQNPGYDMITFRIFNAKSSPNVLIGLLQESIPSGDRSHANSDNCENGREGEYPLIFVVLSG